MPKHEQAELARQAEVIYKERLKPRLEAEHRGQFVVIEPDSGDYFLGRTLSEAAWAASKVYPDRPMYGMRIGYPSAVEFGTIAI
jgi:hypothetical protein